MIPHAHDGAEPGNVVVCGIDVDDSGRGDQALELRDLDPFDRSILEDGQVVVVIARGPVRARVAQALGELDAMGAAERIQLVHRCSRGRRDSAAHPQRDAATGNG